MTPTPFTAFDVAGAVVWTLVAYIFWCGAITPGKPPKPRFGSTEAVCFVFAVIFSFPAIYCISRLMGVRG